MPETVWSLLVRQIACIKEIIHLGWILEEIFWDYKLHRNFGEWYQIYTTDQYNVLQLIKNYTAYTY